MLAARGGDEEAFRALFRRHAPRLVAYADRFFRNRAVAEEMAQEIFLRVHRARGSYEPRARFTTWLYTIASRVCLNELRRRRSRPEDGSGEAAEAAPDPGGIPGAEEALAGRELEVVVQRCLDALPEHQRLALVLTRFGEHSYAEAGALLGVSEGAVKSLVFRAASAVQQALADAGASVPGAGGPG